MYCDYCDTEFGPDDQLVEYQPLTLTGQGEIEYQNMAWRLHRDCIPEFIEKRRS